MTTLAQSDIGAGLVLTVVGMGVVFSALIFLMVLVRVLALGDARPRRAKPAPPAPAASDDTPPAKPDTKAPLDPTLIAVITAAAAAALGVGPDSIRVTRYRWTASDWQASGRRTLTTSHRPTSQAPRKLRP